MPVMKGTASILSDYVQQQEKLVWMLRLSGLMNQGPAAHAPARPDIALLLQTRVVSPFYPPFAARLGGFFSFDLHQ